MATKNPVGRPRVADKAYNYTIRITNAEREEMQLSGGVKWLKKTLKENKEARLKGLLK